MEENNKSNAGNYLPNEIPIPGMEENHDTVRANDPYQNNPYGTAGSVNEQRDSSYGQPNQSNNPYGQPNQSISPYGMSNQENDPYGQQIYPYHPNGKKKGYAIKILIGVACALVVLAAIGIGVMAYFRSTPSYKIGKGLYRLSREIGEAKNPLLEKIGLDDLLTMMQEEGSHVESSLNFSTELPLVGTTTLGIDTDFYKDMKAKELNADTSISMMNYDFAHVNIYADEDVFCFSIPELFMEDMYIENENVVSQFNDSILAESGYASDAEDFSIDLFGQEKRTALNVFRDLSEVRERFEADVKACRDAMTLEKAGKGLYRVILPAEETDRLMKDFLKSYDDVYGMEEELGIFSEYDELILSDISLLFEIDGHNRIESIIIEEPVKMLDGSAAAAGEIFFMGEERSIDMIQGKLSVDVGDRGTRALIGQMQLTPSQESYQLNMDLKLAESSETLGKMKLVMNCDAVKDRFDITYSLQDDEDDIEVIVEGSFDDIVQGESFELDLEKAELNVNDEGSYRITGDIMVEPLSGEVQASVKAKTAFFEMSWADWANIIERIDDAYGSLLDSLW